MDNNITDYSLGAGAGYLSYKGATKLGAKIRKPYVQTVTDNMRSFSQCPLNRDALKKATYDGYVQSGLKAKKVYIHNVNEENIDHIAKLMNKKARIFTLHSKFLQILNKIKRNKNSKSLNLKIVGKGENAFYSPITKDIVINTDKFSGASFHEMGHALNATGSKLVKTLAIGRHITKLFVPVILAIGLLKPKKKDGQEPNGIIDKTTTFIKNNAGKLAFASLIPTLAEEGLASIRGGQIAKKILDPKLLKQVNKHNFFAWTTDLAGALITSGAVALAVKIRDKIAQK